MDTMELYKTAKNYIEMIKSQKPELSSEKDMTLCIIADNNDRLYTAASNVTVVNDSVKTIDAEVIAAQMLATAKKSAAEKMIIVRFDDFSIVKPGLWGMELLVRMDRANKKCQVVAPDMETFPITKLLEEEKKSLEENSDDSVDDEDTETEEITNDISTSDETDSDVSDVNEESEENTENAAEEDFSDENENEEPAEDNEQPEKEEVSEAAQPAAYAVEIDKSNPFYEPPAPVKNDEIKVLYNDDKTAVNTGSLDDDDDDEDNEGKSSKDLIKEAKKNKKNAKKFNSLFKRNNK